MKTQAIIVCCLCVYAASALGGEGSTCWGQKVTFQNPSVRTPASGHLLPAPSETKVGVVSSFESLLLVLSEDGTNWKGPFVNGHGYARGGVTVADFPLIGWTEGSDDEEVFVVDRKGAFGSVADADAGAAQPVEVKSGIVGEWRDLATGRLRASEYQHNISTEQILTEASKDSIRQSQPGIGTSGQSFLPLPISSDEFWSVHDVFSPNTQALCCLRKNDELVGLDLATGKITNFRIQGHRESIGTYGKAVFSPDGKWVLVLLSYGPDDERDNMRGYLQMFTNEGQFVEEVAAFEIKPPYPSVLSFYWLRNNWLVYFDGHEITFRKFFETCK